MTVKVIDTYEETDADGIWIIREYSTGTKGRQLKTPTQSYIDAKEAKPKPVVTKSPTEKEKLLTLLDDIEVKNKIKASI